MCWHQRELGITWAVLGPHHVTPGSRSAGPCPGGADAAEGCVITHLTACGGYSCGMRGGTCRRAASAEPGSTSACTFSLKASGCRVSLVEGRQHPLLSDHLFASLSHSGVVFIYFLSGLSGIAVKLTRFPFPVQSATTPSTWWGP